MALITCPECNREISDKARKCPGCGIPLTAIIAPLKETEPQQVISTKPIQEKPPQKRCINCGVELNKVADYCDGCNDLSKPTKLDKAMFIIVPTVIILFVYLVFFKH